MLLITLPWHPPQDPHSPLGAIVEGLAKRHADPQVRHAARFAISHLEHRKENLPFSGREEDIGTAEGEGPNRDYVRLRLMEGDASLLREHAAQLPAYLDHEDSTIRLVTWRILLRVLGEEEIEGELYARLLAEIESAPDPFHALHLFEQTSKLETAKRAELLTKLPECVMLGKVEGEVAKLAYAQAPHRLPCFAASQEPLDEHWQEDAAFVL